MVPFGDPEIFFRCDNVAMGGGTSSEVKVDFVEFRWPSIFTCGEVWVTFDHNRRFSVQPEAGEGEAQVETDTVVVGQGGGFTGGMRFDIPRAQRFEDILGEHILPEKTRFRNMDPKSGGWVPQEAGFNFRVTVIRDDSTQVIDRQLNEDGTYIVQASDTLWDIAQEFLGSGTLWTLIVEANGIADPDLIHVGQTLTIPNGN